MVHEIIKRGKKTFSGGNNKPALRKATAARDEFRSTERSSVLKKASLTRNNREKQKVCVLGALLTCSVKPARHNARKQSTQNHCLFFSFSEPEIKFPTDFLPFFIYLFIYLFSYLSISIRDQATPARISLV